MSLQTGIEWTDATWNPVSGCTRDGPECDNCYAVPQTYRLEKMGQVEKYGGLTVLNPQGDRHFNGIVRWHEDALPLPFHRKKPTVYFVNSMSDLFHKSVPVEFIAKVWAVMGLASWHTFQILTKRPQRMADILNDPAFADAVEEASTEFSCEADDAAQRFGFVDVHRRVSGDWRTQDHSTLPLGNVWLGTSCGTQKTANEKIPHLRRCPAALHFLSCEPLLGSITLPEDFLEPDFADDDPRCTRRWVIVGGESGGKARPFDLAWARSIIIQCADFGVPCFVKQMGSNPGEFVQLKNAKGGDPAEWPEDLRVRQLPEVRA